MALVVGHRSLGLTLVIAGAVCVLLGSIINAFVPQLAAIAAVLNLFGLPVFWVGLAFVVVEWVVGLLRG